MNIRINDQPLGFGQKKMSPKRIVGAAILGLTFSPVLNASGSDSDKLDLSEVCKTRMDNVLNCQATIRAFQLKKDRTYSQDKYEVMPGVLVTQEFILRLVVQHQASLSYPKNQRIGFSDIEKLLRLDKDPTEANRKNLKEALSGLIEKKLLEKSGPPGSLVERGSLNPTPLAQRVLGF